MLPFGYAIRNLFRDPARLLQTVLGSALAIVLVMGAVAINHGMNGVLSASGSDKNVMLVGAGSEESVLRSEIGEKAAGIAEGSIAGIHKVLGTYAVSPEIHQMTFVTVPTFEPCQALVRGVTTRSLLVYPKVRLIEGHFPGPGEIAVGRLAGQRLDLPFGTLKIGQEIQVEDLTVKISGIFAAPGTVMESEIWMDLNDVRTLAQRENLSCVVIRLDEGDFADVDLFTKQRLDLELAAIRENDYYGFLATFYAPIQRMTWITVLMIATGAILGGMNTLYAAFGSRIREIATLQAIGFRRRAIFLSLVQESTTACLAGALLAALGAILVFEGFTISFSIGSFILHVTPMVALVGLGTGVFLGLAGAIPPALRCLLPPLPSSIRAAG